MGKAEPHPKNAPGPFYVVNGCCISCMVPHSQAPTLMGYDEEEGHCFVKQQPKSPDDMYQTIRAVWFSELQCLRYGGQDPVLLRRLAEIGEAGACDQPPPAGAACLLRNHVSFQASATDSRRGIAHALQRYLDSAFSHYSDYKITPPTDDGHELHLSVSWYQDDYHPIWVGPGEPNACRWLIRHSPVMKSGSIALSLTLDDWLRTDPAYADLRWYTADQWTGPKEGWQSLPY